MPLTLNFSLSSSPRLHAEIAIYVNKQLNIYPINGQYVTIKIIACVNVILFMSLQNKCINKEMTRPWIHKVVSNLWVKCFFRVNCAFKIRSKICNIQQLTSSLRTEMRYISCGKDLATFQLPCEIFLICGAKFAWAAFTLEVLSLNEGLKEISRKWKKNNHLRWHVFERETNPDLADGRVHR